MGGQAIVGYQECKLLWISVYAMSGCMWLQVGCDRSHQKCYKGSKSTLAMSLTCRSFDPFPNRVEEPVVVILVHPSPSLNKAANFELKRAIARTWAKDVEDFGASVFFVGEHDGETVMRRPSEFQGRAQSLTSRFGPESMLGKDGAGPGAGTGYSKEEPIRKMLIPSILENGQADNPSGLLKVKLNA